MPLGVRVVFGFFGACSLSLGLLMILSPRQYPKLYEGFLNKSVMRRQQTARDRALTVRAHGLLWGCVGAFFLVFVWALH